MTTPPSASGADLARQALAAARAAAKTRPDTSQRKTRRSIRPTRGEGRDPQGLGSILERLQTDNGWDASIDGGSLLDQWVKICPTELADNVRPTAYDAERGLLTLQPSSPAYATQVRLFQHKLIQHLNTKLGKPAVRALRVLPPGRRPGTAPEPADQPTTPAPEAPVKTRETAHPGYRQALAAVLENRPARTPENPYIEEARRRQEAAARAHRLPDTTDLDTYRDQQPTGPQPGSVEASRAAALAYKRQHATGNQGPRRAFDVA